MRARGLQRRAVNGRVTFAIKNILFDLPEKIATLLRNFQSPWFIAGGWAIDLFLEQETRLHADVEIAIFRPDQIALRNYLNRWHLKKAENGKLSDWRAGEFLELPIHEIHCFNKASDPPNFEVLLNETNGTEWIYRRNRNVTKPVSELYLASKSGVSFLRPEAVLLYKSKNPREKDEQDFQTVVKFLDIESRNWLGRAISISHSEHHWLEKL